MKLESLTARQQRAYAMASALALAAQVFAETSGVPTTKRSKWLAVPGGHAMLRKRLDAQEPKHFARTLRKLQEMGLFCREGTRLSVFVGYFCTPLNHGLCEVCGAKAGPLRGARYCATCNQGKRREWKGDVLEVWRRGKLAGLSDSAIIQRAHNRVRRVDAEGVAHVIPRWGRVSDEGGEDGRHGGDGAASEGLIPAMVSMGLISPDWLDLAREARRDGGEEGISDGLRRRKGG